MKYSKNSGFTLIELLIVIAIIGVLASIVVVSLTGQGSKADDAALKANLRGAVTSIVEKTASGTTLSSICSDADVKNIMDRVFTDGFVGTGSYLAATHAYDSGASTTTGYYIGETVTSPSTVARSVTLATGTHVIPYGCAADADGWALWGRLETTGDLFCIDSYSSAGISAVPSASIPEIGTHIDKARCETGTAGIGR